MMSFKVSHSARAVSGAAALALALLAGHPVLAQTAATTPPPAPEASQPELPPATMAAAHDLVVASGMARSFEPMVPQLMDQIVPLLTRTRPELTGDLNAVLKQLQPEFVKDGEQMIDIAARIYATKMSEQELKDAATFFNSPVGKKYVEVQPAMLDELVVSMQSWTQKLSTIMMTRVRQEMIKKGHNDF